MISINKQVKIFIFFYLYSFLLLFFLSPDSYLYDLYHRCDTAYFFTCGKAWMNGLVPYVDFADSKGPLLWLIYGLGYLIHPYSYVGVFWVSCIFYAVSFLFAYKLCRIFLSKETSIIVLAILPFFLFYKNYHYEVRAEDFCSSFVFISLYCLCKILKGVDKKKQFWLSFVVGMCLLSTLLMKWSITMMMSGIAFVILYKSFRTRTLYGLYGGLLGILAVAAPFLLYFFVQGNFSAFIFEYFSNTYATVEKPFVEMLDTYIDGWKCLNKPLIAILIGIFFFCRKCKISYWLLFCFFTFLSVAVIAPNPYYLGILLPFSIFLLVFLLSFFENKFVLNKYKIAIAFIIIYVIVVFANIHTEKTFVFQHDKNRQSYYDVSLLMSKVRNPKIMFYQYDTGLGILANSLPAGKYWAHQNGATPIMDKERMNTIMSRTADFVVFSGHYMPKGDIRDIRGQLERNGYVLCGKVIGEYDEGNVYCKKEIYRKLPHSKLCTIDLLLKRSLEHMQE